MYQHYILWQDNFLTRCESDPRKVQALTDVPPLKYKKELQSFLGIINYLSKFPSEPAGLCVWPQKLISVKADWTWNRTYQDLYDRAKKIVKKDLCIKFHDTRSLYLDTDASCISLGAR